jgi:hypothetical protein
MPMLPFTNALIVTTAGDDECAQLADRHYSRETPGARQFMPNGRKLILRDMAGLVVFGWLWSPVELRLDKQDGYNCTIFRNESDLRASDLILEAERHAVEHWGPGRAFTYVDPRKVKASMVRGYPVWGLCFYRAGWSFGGLSQQGKHLLAKELLRGV